MAERTTKVSNETWGTPEARRAEANRIVHIIVSDCDLDVMTPRERQFVEQMGDDKAGVSPAQLTWLRDIKDKY